MGSGGFSATLAPRLRPSRSRLRANTLLCLTSTLLPAGPLAGQQEGSPVPPTKFTTWATAAPINILSPVAAAVALTAQHRQLVMSLRLAGWDDPCDASDCWPNGDIGVVAGYGAPAGGRWHWWAGAGIAQGFDDNSNFLAIPLQAEVTWRPLKFLGVGLMGFASLGTGEGSTSGTGVEPDARSFGGLALAAQLGKVR